MRRSAELGGRALGDEARRSLSASQRLRCVLGTSSLARTPPAAGWLQAAQVAAWARAAQVAVHPRS